MSKRDSNIPTTDNQKKPRWDFKTFAHFEEHPSGDFDVQSGSGTTETAVNQQKQSPDESNSEESPYKEIAYSITENTRFALSAHKTEFVLNALSEEPDDALRQAFEEIIARAISNAEKSGNEVYSIGFTLDGDALSDPIFVPPRPPQQNTADTLMAELDKIGQSDGEDGLDKRTLLLSRPIQLIVTCMTPPTGSGGPRFHPYQNFGYNEDHRIRIENVDDRLCLFYALIASREYHDLEKSSKNAKQQQKNTKNIKQKKTGKKSANHKNNPHRARALNRLVNNQFKMRKLVEHLIHEAEIPDNQNSYGMESLQPVQDLWDRKHPGMYRIVLFEEQPMELPKPLWKGPSGRKHDVVIFLSKKHYDGITKVHCFFKLGRKYCMECECSYQRDDKHTIQCKARCYQCGKVGPDYPCAKEENVKIRCNDCNRFFFSGCCYEGHKNTMCKTWKRCNNILCQRVYLHDPKKPHKCFTKYCWRCKVYHEKDSGCYIQKLVIPEEKQRYRIIVWDSETRLEPLMEGQQIHMVNYLSARVTCTDCIDSEFGEIDDCEICANENGEVERMKNWSEADGHNPVADFVEWILRAWDDEFDTYIWAHNASKFDGHFVFRYLAKTKRRPHVIMNGLKIYQFTIQHRRENSKLVWRDSCLLMPIRLEQLKSTFNLQCTDKPFFPYGFNRTYEQNKYTPFYLPDELAAYCQNDTDLLLKSIVEFRRILMTQVTDGFDILPISCTIASACMNIFRAQYMNKDQLAMVPEGGYERNDRASVFAIKYLDWRAMEDGVEIQHAGNGREKRIKGYKLDGWIEKDKKAIEVMGCFWHGCERCFHPGQKLFDEKTCREKNQDTQDRLRQLREPDQYGNTIQVEEIWECEIIAQMRRNEKMRKFFGDIGKEKGPIDPRTAYCGGRTGPLKLFAEADSDYKISIFDIISLYPWVNYDTFYPVGIPKIIHPSPNEIFVNWTDPSELQYKGIYRVRVIPPQGLRIPVLPVKMDERLLFGCCHRCAAKFRKSVSKCVHKCTHDEQKRAYTGSYTHIELQKALENGYKIDRFWRAWHYEKWSDQIFKGYVRQFLKLKVEATGFPTTVQTEEQKHEFAAEYKRIYDVDLNLQNVMKNPGLRFIAKLCLNSLWGKFSMRNSLGENKVITQAPHFFKILFDQRVEISTITILSDEAIRVLYKPKKCFVTEHACSNIIISLWTTSRARLKLFEYMQKVQKTEGSDPLYWDTDSLIVRHLRGQAPILTGDYLGQMSEEFPGYEILTFVCGAKQYALKMKDKRSGKIDYVQKIRGITFDVENSKALQFEKFKQKVLNYGTEEDPAIFKYDKIQPTKDSKIITRELRKKYLPVCQKGIINDSLEVLPFGFE